MPVIRNAQKSDLPSIITLEQESYGPQGYSHRNVQQFMDLYPDSVGLACEDGRLLAFCIGLPIIKEGWLMSLLVDPNFRRRGLGKILVEHFLNRFRAAGLEEAKLTVHPENKAAVDLYYSMGFRERSFDAEHFGPGQPRSLMVLGLG